MQPQDIINLRLLAQRVASSPSSTVLDTVRWMGALQAQDYGQAVWALGLRTNRATLQTVEKALTQGSIIRTWPMRGTVHFVPAEDATWMLSLGAARMIAADARRMAMLGLDDETLARCGEIAAARLDGRKLLARPELLQYFEDAGVSTKTGRGYHILWRLAQAGVLCIGPMVGKQQGFALLTEWAPQQCMLDREQALSELARRYVTSHGPVTVQDFAWWSGLTISDCKKGLQAAGSSLVANDCNSIEYWYADAITRSNTQSASTTVETLLLPGFDEYFLGYKDRSLFSDPGHMARIVPGNNGVFKPIVVVNGHVVGTWQRKINKHSVDIRVDAFFTDARNRSKLIKQAAPAAEAYATFAGLPLGTLSAAMSNI